MRSFKIYLRMMGRLEYMLQVSHDLLQISRDLIQISRDLKISWEGSSISARVEVYCPCV